MTLRDHEVLELLAGEPELLAIADAVSATQARVAAAPAPRKRRLAVRAGILAAAAVVAIVAVLAAPQSQSGIIGRALAAVGDGRIMHVVTEFSAGANVVNLKTGHRRALLFREELWADEQMNRFHFVLSEGGRVVGDVLWPHDAPKGTAVPTLNPSFVALWTGYRKALEDGGATLAGRGRVYGHAVYWIRFTSVGGDPATDVGVDIHTYRPIVFRSSPNGVLKLDQRVLVAKAIPYAPSEFVRRGPRMFGGGHETGSSSSSGIVDPYGSRPVALHAPWLTAGPAAAGLELRFVSRYTETSTRGTRTVTSKGVELTYSASPGAGDSHSTTIVELRRSDLGSRPPVPGGSMLITVGTESSGRNDNHRLWTGSLRQDGIYLTIETRSGERTLLEIARALHTTPKRS